MSSRASAKSPTPGSSASSKQPVRSLAEEMETAPMNVDSDDEVTLKKETYDRLRERVKKGDADIAKVQTMYNETANELQNLKIMIQQFGNGPQRIQDLENEVIRLREQEASTNVQALQERSTLSSRCQHHWYPIQGGRQKLKLSAPITYDGTPGTLKGFLIQVKNYQNFHHGDFTSETEKVVHAASFLRGRALKWFEPIQEEYLSKETLDECSTEVRDIYSNFNGFEALRSLFQDPDEKRQAERDLAQLRQTKSAKEYSAEFRRLSAQLDLTDDTKMFMFYQGLKDEVKDELVKLDRPEDFLQYGELAIRIDNRLYERKKERKERPNTGRKYQWQPQRSFQANQRPRNNWNNNRQSTAYGQHDGPMDLSVAKREDNRPRKDFKCYNCDKPGHMARDCRQPKRIQHQPVPEKRANIASKEIPHAQLSWTACYDDNCLIHQDSKEQTGWYPKKPKNNERPGYDTTPPPVKTLAVATKEEEIPIYRPLTLEDNNIECVAILSQICQNIEEKAKTDPIMKDTLHLLEERIMQRLQASTREQLLKFEERGPDTEEIMDRLQQPHLRRRITYDSDEPRDVARRRAQTEIDHGFYPSVDDTSSDEEPEEPRCKNIDPYEDDQTVQFHGTSQPKEVPMTPLVKGDSSLLNTKDAFHEELFWAECLDDKCLWHLSPKKESRFYPRRRDDRPIKDVYVDDQLPNWTLTYFNGLDKATFEPDPCFPMRCQNSNDMEWDECRHDHCQIHYVPKSQAWRNERTN
ncbi:hypothetical protein HER10_EVM0006305 [Colletotrichum scovillei]|uniref:uncharacterized protein n=1 Tax=Colletotrichum scovillei TaxID=1209932 RepID=UPI0015C3845A|nr:uncharacterized protein HER10_EVM0006305 [Colletotrichum scovillei]KAF4776451.1 hypothetical protein HER10_EVM0006305 [Colletotrichum scovillei]